MRLFSLRALRFLSKFGKMKHFQTQSNHFATNSCLSLVQLASTFTSVFLFFHCWHVLSHIFSKQLAIRQQSFQAALGLSCGGRSDRFQSSSLPYSFPLKQPSKNNPNSKARDLQLAYMREYSLSECETVYVAFFRSREQELEEVQLVPCASCHGLVNSFSFILILPLLYFYFISSCQPYVLLPACCRAHFTSAVNLRMSCTVPQKCPSFYISSQGSWNGWLVCKHLSCSHLETGKRWHQHQHSESYGFIEKGIESSGMAQPLQPFHHSIAWSRTLLIKTRHLSLV